MRSSDYDDPVLDALRALTIHTPDFELSERVRGRCHAQLDSKRRILARWQQAGRFADRILVPAFVAGLSAVYLAAIVGNVLQLRGL